MATSQPVEILGGRAELQIAQLGSSILHPAFNTDNTQQLLTVIEEPINSWKTITHTYQAKDSSYTDEFLTPLKSLKPPIVSVRFGLTAAGESQWRQWEDMVIVSMRPSIRADSKSGPLVTIKLCDRLWLLHAAKMIIARRGNISGIMSDIWQHDAAGAESIIEPTNLTGHTTNTGLWYQSNESSWSFITRVLLPLAENSAGTAGYRVFVRDNTLRFHCPGYKAAEPKKLYYTAGTPGFDSLAVEDYFVELAGGGGAAHTAKSAYDPTTGKYELLQSDEAKLVKFAAVRPDWSNVEYSVAHTGSNLISAENARNQSKYAAINGEIFRCIFSADKCLDVRVGDVIDIVLSSANSDSVMHGGKWLVNSAIHTLQEGGLRSKFIGTRGDYAAVSARQVLNTDEFGLGTDSAGINFAPGDGQNAANGVSVPVLNAG